MVQYITVFLSFWLQQFDVLPKIKWHLHLVLLFLHHASFLEYKLINWRKWNVSVFHDASVWSLKLYGIDPFSLWLGVLAHINGRNFQRKCDQKHDLSSRMNTHWSDCAISLFQIVLSLFVTLIPTARHMINCILPSHRQCDQFCHLGNFFKVLYEFSVYIDSTW